MSHDDNKMHAPGTFVLALIFLLWFIVIYFVQWFALWDNWPIG